MTQADETMRAALREIESRAATALANQPENSDERGRHLNKALAGIELKAHVARNGGKPADILPLEYVGRGQIVNARTRDIVSPRLVVELYNRLAAGMNRESPARGVESQVPRNGEAKADCSRLAVKPWRKRGRARILLNKPRRGPRRNHAA